MDIYGLCVFRNSVNLMKIFSRDFSHLDASSLQDLETLELEGAIYAQFYRESIDDFRLCRIEFTPSEIVEYVTASQSYNEFLRAKKEQETTTLPLLKYRVSEFRGELENTTNGLTP